MRFYVPEWEDHVDAEYDFTNDEHSAISRSDRSLAYIWDIFDRDPAETPIDGILISREQIEDSPERARRLRKYGVYDAPNDGTTLEIPEWLPTISDCGAWGYRDLPFPPYGNEEMLDFYEQLHVDVGVTIDHLVLGSGHASRLYVDESAFYGDISREDLPDAITDTVDVMISEWPDSEEWPDYVTEYDQSITAVGPPHRPERDLFDVDVSDLDLQADKAEVERRVRAHLEEIADDPRVVYREDDMEFRYELTLDNLEKMQSLYERGDYSFRLMCAIQGWDTSSYAQATRKALSEGYQYLGIGGVAGSQVEDVERYVAAVGQVVKDQERAHDTRVDTHVFGFAKPDAFETIGRSGMSSFDSASMLRAAWTGGDNYHLDTVEERRRYDALRVRYPGHKGTLADAIEISLWSQEVLAALRAYDRGEPIADAIDDWHAAAKQSLDGVEAHLEANRWEDPYNQWRIRDFESAFRSHYEYGRELKANFSDRFLKRIIKLLRTDDPDDPVPFEKYTELVETARDCLETFPRTNGAVRGRVQTGGGAASFEAIWSVVEPYTEAVEDENHRDAYVELLRDRPWEECDCPVCSELGIEVGIFRGNNRNRRRGFHNTKRFYDQFEQALPKTLILTKGGSSLSTADTVEEFLVGDRPAFWSAVNDLPVAEIGTVTAEGVHEWWDDPPTRLSFAPSAIKDRLAEFCARYSLLYVDGSNWDVSEELRDAIEAVGCEVVVAETPTELRESVLDRLGYDERTIPPHPERTDVDQFGLQEF